MAPTHPISVFGDIEDDDDDRSSQSPDDDDDLDNDNDEALPADDDDEEDDDEEDNRCTSTACVPVAVPSASVVTIAAVSNGSDSHHTPSLDIPAITLSLPDPKRPRIIPPFEVVAIHPQQILQERKPLPPDETRRLFQRLWTDEDEIELLQGFLDFSTQRGGGGPHLDTNLFYDQIKSKLQLDFNKNQLVEKLRRLKKKYRTVVGKINSGKDFSFKNPHDQATFEISKKIWSNSFNSASLDDEDGDVKFLEDNPHRPISFLTPTSSSKKRPRPPPRPNTPLVLPHHPKLENRIDNTNDNAMKNNPGKNNLGVPSNGNPIEESMRSCLTPLLKEVISGIWNSNGGLMGGGSRGGVGGLMMNALPVAHGWGGGDLGLMSDERWRKQQILELEVYYKRLELVQHQIRQQLDELRSFGTHGG